MACWREALLAQAVLAGSTRGYRQHPQVARFQAQPDPLAAIGTFLEGLLTGAQSRGYQFDERKIVSRMAAVRIPETKGQLVYEWGHLLAKLRTRDPGLAARLHRIQMPAPHPLFRIIPGAVREWERQPQ